MESATKLAQELWELRDPGAENEVLHRVSLVPTEDPADREVMAYSYLFKTDDELEAAGLYWQTRLMVIKLQTTLRIMQAVQSFGGRMDIATDHEGYASLETVTEQTRLVANLIMCWQAGSKPAALGRDMMQSLVVIWGALADRADFRTMPASVSVIGNLELH
ncbi:hypothetical protein LTR85_005912 [Meristemomyces frigidus]|nr:hypothetical protein LTR85_005912 [Meristemomyces frigidus]